MPDNSDDRSAGLRRFEAGSDPFAGLKELGDEVARSSTRGDREGRRRKQRRGWRVALITGIVVIVLAGGLAAGEYGYVEWKLSQITSVKCHSCKVTPAGTPFNVLVVGSDSRVRRYRIGRQVLRERQSGRRSTKRHHQDRPRRSCGRHGEGAVHTPGHIRFPLGHVGVFPTLHQEQDQHRIRRGDRATGPDHSEHAGDTRSIIS